jgi:secondary thiamine-phosphate synthase enzyme
MIFSGKGGATVVESRRIKINTKGNCDITDITGQVAREVSDSSISSGIVTIFNVGSTAGITTIENEPGVLSDFKAMWDRLIPVNISYKHDLAWGDGNGHSHVRASVLSASITIPFTDKRMTLGTWQQIVHIDFDNRPRSREIVLQIMGE